MKECKYCRTKYDDNLSACPSCGGTKVITAQEKAEDAALYQKEIENRENAVAVVATKRKMLISVLVGIVVLIIAVITMASYNANKPLSNGMTKDEGEAILAEGIAFYNDGDYESAIECFVQLPSDSKQYDEAQSMLTKCEDEYSASIVEKANGYVENGEYEMALNLLKNAGELLPNNTYISATHDNLFKEYKNIIFTNAFSEAEKFVAAGNYPAGIQAINGAIKQIGTDDDASAKLQTYMSTYKSIVIENADNALASTGYADAISIINEGLKILNGDNDLLNKIDEYKTYAPVYLSYDDAYAINKYLRTGITDNSWLTDNEDIDESVFADTNIKFGYLLNSLDAVIGARISNFTHHALVVGAPGNGKTTFALNLLLQFYEKGIPFLAIEPTKTEYRTLVDCIPDLQI